MTGRPRRGGYQPPAGTGTCRTAGGASPAPTERILNKPRPFGVNASQRQRGDEGKRIAAGRRAALAMTEGEREALVNSSFRIPHCFSPCYPPETIFVALHKNTEKFSPKNTKFYLTTRFPTAILTERLCGKQGVLCEEAGDCSSRTR